jgi:hypothetical protein
MAGRNRGRKRTIDEGHLGVLSFQTRRSIQTLQAGLRHGGHRLGPGITLLGRPCGLWRMQGF